MYTPIFRSSGDSLVKTTGAHQLLLEQTRYLHGVRSPHRSELVLFALGSRSSTPVRSRS
jgi:hypothetical protein